MMTAGVWAEEVAAVTKKRAVRKGQRLQERSQAPSERMGGGYFLKFL